jgi:hypothetical protein
MVPGPFYCLPGVIRFNHLTSKRKRIRRSLVVWKSIFLMIFPPELGHDSGDFIIVSDDVGDINIQVLAVCVVSRRHSKLTNSHQQQQGDLKACSGSFGSSCLHGSTGISGNRPSGPQITKTHTSCPMWSPVDQSHTLLPIWRPHGLQTGQMVPSLPMKNPRGPHIFCKLG